MTTEEIKEIEQYLQDNLPQHEIRLELIPPYTDPDSMHTVGRESPRQAGIWVDGKVLRMKWLESALQKCRDVVGPEYRIIEKKLLLQLLRIELGYDKPEVTADE